MPLRINSFWTNKETPRILWTAKVYYSLHNLPIRSPIICQINAIHALPPCFLKILKSKRMCPKRSNMKMDRLTYALKTSCLSTEFCYTTHTHTHAHTHTHTNTHHTHTHTHTHTHISDCMKMRPVGGGLFHADRRTGGRTDMTLIMAFLNFVNAPKNSTFCPHGVCMCFVWIWEQTATIFPVRH